MKRKSLPEMFMIASVLTDGDAQASLELPTQLDPILPSAMRAQLEAAVGAKSPKASKATKALPVIAALPARPERKPVAKPGAMAATTRSSRAWIPIVAFLGIGGMTLFAAVRNGAYFTAPSPAIVEPAAQAPEAPPLDPVVAAALALPSTPSTPVSDTTNEPFDVPVSVPVIARTPVITVSPRGTQQGMTAARIDPPKGAAVAAVPQPQAPIAKPTAAPTDAPPAKAKVDADFEAAMRAAQRANQQLDTTLR